MNRQMTERSDVKVFLSLDGIVTIQQGDSPLLRAYGLMGWTGDHETLEQIALDQEFLPEEAG